MTIHLQIRGYKERTVCWEKSVDMESEKLDQLLPRLATAHCEAMVAGKIDMIEIEFLDEPDPDSRFFRFGTNPDGMMQPYLWDSRPN